MWPCHLPKNAAFFLVIAACGLGASQCAQQDLVDDPLVASDTIGANDGIVVVSDTASGCGNCDDKNACTDDSCSPAGACIHAPKSGQCDDGNACTTGETCKDGSCTGGTTLKCPSKGSVDPCFSYSCDPTSGCQSAPLDGKACDDGDGCTDNDVCNGGICGSVAGPNCNDNNPCTDDTCDKLKGCSHTDNAVSCSDGNGCTQGDACAAGKCTAGPAAVCDDGNPCTDDSCDAGSANCVFLPNNASCTDANACTANDVCVAGVCSAQPSCGCQNDIECDDKNACTKDSCSAAGVCSFTAQGAEIACDDGNDCSSGDSCKGGKCAAGVNKKCDDDNVCTDDACVPGIGCTHGANKATCDDGLSCSAGDSCKDGKCGADLTGCGCKGDSECDDSNACSDDACVMGKCVSKSKKNGTLCSDGNGCTAEDSCQGGSCLPGTAVKCDDANACTDDSCDPKAGTCVHKNNAALCQDNDTCTVGDACDSGACKGGAAPNCDDKNVCTTDSCAKDSGCEHGTNSLTCDDGNACTTQDACDNKACAGGPAPACDDKNVCSDDSCDSKLGCVNLANGVTCSDGNACTADDACKDKGCVGGAAPDCNDKNTCTTDSCDLASGCTHTDNAAQCEDGDACTAGDKCAGGTCKGGSAIDCDDTNLCTTDSCDPIKGCVHANGANDSKCSDTKCDNLTFVEAGKCFSGVCLPGQKNNCDDGNLCTTNTCNIASGCKTESNSEPCDDGTVCTKDDVCKNKVCTSGAAIVCSDGNPCTNDSCDAVKGCVAANASDFTTCKIASCDGKTYDAGSVCSAGVCQASAKPVSCDDGNLCTDDACSATAGCSHANNAIGCDDGNLCTLLDVCGSGACIAGAALVCEDNKLCTDDSCDPKVGCKFAGNTKVCDDGTVCTSGDVCKDGKCNAGGAVVCDDKNPCTTDSCDAAKGCIFANNAVLCDDGNSCNSADVCKDGVCKGSGGVNCDDNNPCTVDTCDGIGLQGCKHSAVGDGVACSVPSCSDGGYQGVAVCAAGKCGEKPVALSCDDKNLCTTDVCNVQQGCLHPVNALSCDDKNACTSADQCAAGVCGGKATVCPDGNTCKISQGCNITSGICQYLFPSDKACNDGDACTYGDKCAGGKCVAGLVVVTCDDKNPCTADSCDSLKGCSNTPVAGAACDDANACTSGDVCTLNGCAGAKPSDCDDKNVCTTDSCDAKNGCIHAYNNAGCNDDNACTTKDLCADGKCYGGVALVCDDKNACTVDSCDAIKGCQAVAAADKTICAKPTCTVYGYQTAALCSAGVCGQVLPVTCDDGVVCTTDVCDLTVGCTHSNKAFGTPCKSSNPNLHTPFCSGAVCTGLEVQIAASNNLTISKAGLTGIDRNPSGGISASGYQVGIANTVSGAMAAINDGVSPPGVSSQGSGGLNARMSDVRDRLAVGGLLNGKGATAMVYSEKLLGWTNITGPDVSSLTRPLNAVELTSTSGGDNYMVGGTFDSAQLIASNLWKVSYTQFGWGAATHLLITKGPNIECAKQVTMDVQDVYAASDKAVFIAGNIWSNGAATEAAVAFYDGNSNTSCGSVVTKNNNVGEAYLDPDQYNEALRKTINVGSNTPVGSLRAVHGSSENHVMAGGTYGTLFGFDNNIWTQLTPNFKGMPVAWSSSFDVKGVAIGDSEGWVGGDYYYNTQVVPISLCRSPFALHGTFKAGVWSWDFLTVDVTLGACGTLDPSSIARVWYDKTGGALYLVGSQGVDANGAASLSAAVTSWPLVVRIKP